MYMYIDVFIKHLDSNESLWHVSINLLLYYEYLASHQLWILVNKPIVYDSKRQIMTTKIVVN